jgi:phage head maturation protease
MISLFAKVAPVYSPELVLDDTLRRKERTLYQAGAFRQQRDLPLLIDHDDAQRVGTVREILEHRDTDGLWHAVIADVDDPPAWLKRGTPVSIGFAKLSRTEANGCERILDALLTEVSILSPATRPAEPNARVLSLGIAHREAEQTIDTRGVTIRRNLGTPLAVR